MTFFVTTAPDGAVVSAGTCPDAYWIRQAPTDPNGHVAKVDELTYEAVRADIQGFYLWGGKILPRLPLPVTASKLLIAADGEDEAVISGIPPGTTIQLSGLFNVPEQPVESDHVTITLTERGRLTVELRCPPSWRPWKETIDAA